MSDMEISQNSKKGWGLMAVFFLLYATLHVYLALAPIRLNSPTYDEAVHLTAGAVYWKTKDYRFNGTHHPAFAEMWPALPLLFFGPMIPRFHPSWLSQTWQPREQYAFADAFLNLNRVPFEKMMESGRMMQLVLSLFLGGILGALAFRLRGLLAGFLALAFWSLSPTMLAHGTLISTDLAFAVFFFLFFASCLFWENTAGRVVMAMSLGFCLASKYLAVSLGPVMVCLFLFYYFRKSLSLTPGFLWRVFLVGLGSVVILLFVYRFSEIGVFWEGIRLVFSLLPQ